jgi:pimeloyl-ACP methyl ester carboxylesterase
MDLDWYAGMAEFNVGMFLYAVNDPGSLEAELEKHVAQFRGNSEDVLVLAWPELVAREAKLLSNTELSRTVTQTYTRTLRDTTHGWIDDLLALSMPWGFDLSDIKVPVELWSGSYDPLWPTAHTVWLAEHIQTCQLGAEPEGSHFSAAEKLPIILSRIVSIAKMGRQGEAPIGLTLPPGRAQ